MKDKNIVVFAKEKYGLDNALRFLKDNFSKVRIFKGARGDVFPCQAYEDKYDICISYMSPWIIPKKLLSSVKEFSINFHPGPPEYRGIGCTNFAVYNNEYKYGVTAHLMTSKIDSGKVINVKYFPILPGDSLVEITNKCYRYIQEQFFYVFNSYIKNGRLPESDKKWSKRLYTRKELNCLCRIHKGMTIAEVRRRIKATNFPNMPRAYLQMFGYRFEYKE